MDTITVNGSTSYNVIIERGILDRVGGYLRDELAGEKALIVTDSNVATLYLNTVAESLKEAGYESYSVVLAPGDQSKSIDIYVDLLQLLADYSFHATDLIIGLGGGMIGDLAGFVGATYQRGMRTVLLPTSLLAAVDASVGGKTAVNMSSGKNQVGTIRNPSIVICDPRTMTTLSDDDLQEGYAEIIKYGILTGYEIIDMLRDAIENKDYAKVICRSVEIKRDVVEMDEGDKNLRQFLNLGHLVGHAIEAASDFNISHGQAVAVGLAVEARAAALHGYTAMSTYLEISSILREFGFDALCSYVIADLAPYLGSDKRIRDGKIDVIVPITIGDCVMQPIEASAIEDYCRRGL